jgi:hypothetical protein
MTDTELTAREPLCDLQMVKAEYGALDGKDGKPDHCFRIKLISAKQDACFDIREEEGELFAAGLEALAAIIRSRVIRKGDVFDRNFDGPNRTMTGLNNRASANLFDKPSHQS